MPTSTITSNRNTISSTVKLTRPATRPRWPSAEPFGPTVAQFRGSRVYRRRVPVRLSAPRSLFVALRTTAIMSAQRIGKRGLKVRRRSEVMGDIAMRHVQRPGHALQGDRIRAAGNEQLSRSRDRFAPDGIGMAAAPACRIELYCY